MGCKSGRDSEIAKENALPDQEQPRPGITDFHKWEAKEGVTTNLLQKTLEGQEQTGPGTTQRSSINSLGGRPAREETRKCCRKRSRTRCNQDRE